MLLTCGFIAAAGYTENTVATFIAIGCSALFWQGYNIERKINRLLDDRGIVMGEDD